MTAIEHPERTIIDTYDCLHLYNDGVFGIVPDYNNPDRTSAEKVAKYLLLGLTASPDNSLPAEDSMQPYIKVISNEVTNADGQPCKMPVNVLFNAPVGWTIYAGLSILRTEYNRTNPNTCNRRATNICDALLAILIRAKCRK